MNLKVFIENKNLENVFKLSKLHSSNDNSTRTFVLFLADILLQIRVLWHK